MSVFKRMAARLPPAWQDELKRLRHHRQISTGRFGTDEPEFLILDQLVAPGDWVVDIGADVGHYTARLSDLVGPSGRVIAVEPVPATFALLAASVARLRFPNVTLLNVAASNQSGVVGLQIPRFDTGLKNYHEAAITEGETGLHVLTLAFDSLSIDHRMALVKIDAEGHDPIVLEGLERLLHRDHPTLILETSSTVITQDLERMGYVAERLPGSPNLLLRWRSTGSNSGRHD